MLVTFDTQEVVNQLKSHGFTDEQAEVLTNIQKQVINDAMNSTLASKGDIHGLKDDIKDLQSSMTIENELIKSRLAIVEKTQWIIIAGVLALVLKSFIL